MQRNYGVQGACVGLTDSKFKAFEVKFVENVALQGGTLFAIQNSFIKFVKSELNGNFANDGAIVYSL